MGDCISSLAGALERSQRVSNALSTIRRKENAERIKRSQDIKERFGRLHEEVIRHAISIAYGFEWGMSVTITDFADAISFVANGLRKTTKETQNGINHLIKALCRGAGADFDSDLSQFVQEVKLSGNFSTGLIPTFVVHTS